MTIPSAIKGPDPWQRQERADARKLQSGHQSQLAAVASLTLRPSAVIV